MNTISKLLTPNITSTTASMIKSISHTITPPKSLSVSLCKYTKTISSSMNKRLPHESKSSSSNIRCINNKTLFLFGDNDTDKNRSMGDIRQHNGGQAEILGPFDRTVSFGIVTTF
eukprot:UN11360